MAKLEDRVAIVTGGATLLGASIGRGLATAGAQVVIADINPEDGERVAAEMESDALFVQVDVTDDKALNGLVSATTERFGGIDILVNGAATYQDDLVETTRDTWQFAFDTNVISGAVLTAKVAQSMETRGHGSIVNIASISGKRAQPLFYVYSATKAAILGLTRNEAFHLAPRGIRVNSVSPGWIWSNPIIGMTNDDRSFVDDVCSEMFLPGRIGDPEEVAAAVVFLASDDASFITGADIAVDGGYTAIGPEQRGEPLAPLLSRMQESVS